MKNKEMSNYIKAFALTQTGPFEFEYLLQFFEGKIEFNQDVEDRLFDLACISRWLFTNVQDEVFVPRHVAFKGAEFRVTPLEMEIKNGFLIPGHRFMPFVAHDVFPGDVELKTPDGEFMPTCTVNLPIVEVQPYLLLFGRFAAAEYLVLDSRDNEKILRPPHDGDVELTAYDFSDVFQQWDFAVGDSLMLTVEDWLEGVFSVRHVKKQEESLDFAHAHKWVNALREGFNEAIQDSTIDQDCYEQVAQTFWLANCNKNAPPVFSNPPLSFSAFFNMQDDLEIQTVGQVSFIWPKDEPPDSRMMNSISHSLTDEPDTELEGMFNMLGVSVSMNVTVAYMREALAHGETNPEKVLARVIHGRMLSFPSPEDQQEFDRLWGEMWEDVRRAYTPENDPHREIRTAFLGLHDQCLGVLRKLDRSAGNPEDFLNNPAHLELAQIGNLIDSVLTLTNEPDDIAGELPVPLNEMIRDLSSAIAQLSGQLGRPASKGSVKGKIYQLKISLQYAKPPIWRRVLVPADIELEDLHEVIQVAFGWTNSHLHQFIDGRTFYQPGAEVDDFPGPSTVPSEGVRLNSLLRKEKQKIVYEYDFGDSWLHTILLEKILPSDPEQELPFCVTGKRACPPEDCGGMPGYWQMLETLAGPDGEEKTDLLDWLGESFDPAAFSAKEVNALFRAWF